MSTLTLPPTRNHFFLESYSRIHSDNGCNSIIQQWAHSSELSVVTGVLDNKSTGTFSHAAWSRQRSRLAATVKVASDTIGRWVHCCWRIWWHHAAWKQFHSLLSSAQFVCSIHKLTLSSLRRSSKSSAVLSTILSLYDMWNWPAKMSGAPFVSLSLSFSQLILYPFACSYSFLQLFLLSFFSNSHDLCTMYILLLSFSGTHNV